MRPGTHRCGPAVLRSLAAALIATASVTGASAQEPPQNFAVHETPKPIPEIRFQDVEGKSLSLAEFRGKTVLLNVWATWCAPCRREMPTLDRLQRKLGGPDFMVLALSIDRAGIDAVRKFFGEVNVQDLAIYIDTTARAATQLGAVGLPATLLIDREGREIGRLIGPAEWDTPEMIAFLRDQVGKQRID